MKKKRILLLTYEYPPTAGGIGRYTSDLLYCLRILGYEPIVISKFQNDKLSERDVVPLFTGEPVKDFIKFLVFYLRFRPAKVVLAHPLTWRIFLPVSLFHRDYVLIIYGSEIASRDKNRAIRNFVWKYLCKRARNIIAISEYSRTVLLSALPEIDQTKIALIYPALREYWFERNNRSDEFRAKHNFHGIVLLTLARIVSRKGHDSVIKSLPEILKKRKNVFYVIAGKGSERSNLEELAKELGVSKNVFFIGYISEDDLPAIYDACDLFVMPTHEDAGKVEGFGYTYIEAAARGKASIAGNHGGAREAVVDGETGYLVDPYQPKEISSKTILLMENTELRKTMENNAMGRAQKEFHINSMISKLAIVFGDKVE